MIRTPGNTVSGRLFIILLVSSHLVYIIVGMKKIAVFLLMVIASVALASPTGKTPQEAYIEKYSPLAVAEMYRSGVPASITLAQGLLESGNVQE